MSDATPLYPFWTRVVYAAAKTAIKLVVVVLFHLKVTGKENELAEGRAIYASNHISAWDPPVLGASVRRELTILAKKELFEIPVLGALIRIVHAQPVDRKGYSRGVLETLRNALERDEAVLLFPEGTRQRDGRLGEGKIGVGMLAVWTGAPVIPMYVSGTRSPGRAFLWRSRFRVALGRAVTPPKIASPSERKEAYQTVMKHVMAEIARLKTCVDQETVHHSSTAQADSASAGDGAA